MDYITKEALLRVAISCTKSNSEASRFLGISLDSYRKNLQKYNMYKE
jgi:DNA-binding protein Fis